jgi:tRNA(Ile)-lysidine synthase
VRLYFNWRLRRGAIKRGEASKYKRTRAGEPEAHRHVLRRRRILCFRQKEGRYSDCFNVEVQLSLSDSETDAKIRRIRQSVKMASQRKTAKRPPATAKSLAERPKLSAFARSLWREWQNLKLNANDRAVIAVSGGADSVSLLLALDELLRSKKLKIDLCVAHLDHKLRKGSRDDARWVANLARSLGYETSIRSSQVAAIAKRTGDNLEQAARRARYAFLNDVAKKFRAKVVLTAHTMDDQAETILLNLLRGSGLEGLSGIEPVRNLDEGGEILLSRPLLSWARRRDTSAYCQARGVEFRTDEMNSDEAFSRVRVRRQVVPLLESFNPKLIEALTRTAELLRDDSRALERGAALLLELSLDGTPGRKAGSILRCDLLAGAQASLRRRALRLWLQRCRGSLRRLERVHVLAVEDLLLSNRGGRVAELPGGGRILRKRGHLYFINWTAR